jgi:amino acid permease
MLAIPIIFQQAGWLAPTVMLIVMGLVATFSATMICEAMSLIPGNSNFQRRVEFTTAVKYYFNQRWYLVSQVLLNVCLQVQIIVGIIVSAQVMDEFIIFFFRRSFALQYAPNLAVVTLVSSQDPYKGFGAIVSLGFVISLVLIIPLGYWPLESQMGIQTVSFFIMLFVQGEFLYEFTHTKRTLDFSQTPLVGRDFSRVLGVIIFSFAHVVSIPSWANEKKPNVSVTTTVWVATWFNFLLYLSTGLLGAWALPNMKTSDFLVILGRPRSDVLAKVAVMLFSLGTLAPGIPIHSIMVRYNLFVGNICSHWWASFWGVIFPWLAALFVYHSHTFGTILNWSALTVAGLANFAVPLALFIKARSVSRGLADTHGVYKSVPSWFCLPPVALAAVLISFTLGLVVVAISYDLILVFTEQSHEVIGPG